VKFAVYLLNIVLGWVSKVLYQQSARYEPILPTISIYHASLKFERVSLQTWAVATVPELAAKLG
jgi:hypothetical protein